MTMGQWSSGAVIRLARDHEVGLVSAIVAAAYQRYVAVIGGKPGPMLDDYAVRIAAHQVWMLAYDDVPLGVLVLEDGPAQFLLDNIAIHPDHQGSGHGRMLMDFAEQQARQQGWDHIVLYTNVLMVENIAIYRKRGYIEEARRTEKGFDRVYMVKPLA